MYFQEQSLGYQHQLIQSYDDQKVVVHQKNYSLPVLVLSHHEPVSIDVSIKNIFDLYLNILNPHKPDVVLLGVGSVMNEEALRVAMKLSEKGRSCEAMTIASACRTFNILLLEDRSVATILLPSS